MTMIVLDSSALGAMPVGAAVELALGRPRRRGYDLVVLIRSEEMPATPAVEPAAEPVADPLLELVATDAHPAAGELPAELLAETPLTVTTMPGLGYAVIGPSGEALYSTPTRRDAERWLATNG